VIYHLFNYFRDGLSHVGFYAYQDVMFRCIAAVLTSFAVAFFFGPRVIRKLVKLKIGDRAEFNHSALNELMRDRQNTPTMGGLLIIAAILAGTLLWARLNNPFVQKAVFIIIWFGGLGAADDWLKLTAASKQRSRDGLKAWEKLLFQFGGAVLVATFLFYDFQNVPDGYKFWLPFYKYGLPLSSSAFILIAVLYISATSNAVNLTDGMDGLASGCIAIASSVLIFLCYVGSETMGGGAKTWASYLLLPHIPGAGELSIFFGAMLGAVMGFLWYNCRPAQVFMGDTGSLPLGAAMGYGALVTRHEILLLIIGGVFVMELLSVMIQVGYFKYSGGKRVFLCAPIHHHFHLAGWQEPQVVVRFWLLAAAFAGIALATLKLR
jgi:phospho-N-acetylmuramoyl-pentapeptide-transferase